MIRALHIRFRSLVRGNVAVFASTLIALALSDFPHNRPTLWLILPTLGVVYGTAETARCLQRRWNWYHATVILCLYADMMSAALILFALLYPYATSLR